MIFFLNEVYTVIDRCVCFMFESASLHELQQSIMCLSMVGVLIIYAGDLPFFYSEVYLHPLYE